MILWTMSRTLPVLFQSLGTLRQAFSVWQDPEDLGDIPCAQALQVKEGNIVFDAVSFRYGRSELFEDKQVCIKGGERVGLVGYTGAGKSTFVHLIMRFFPVDSGRILIDGQNIAEVTLESL